MKEKKDGTVRSFTVLVVSSGCSRLWQNEKIIINGVTFSSFHTWIVSQRGFFVIVRSIMDYSFLFNQAIRWEYRWHSTKYRRRRPCTVFRSRKNLKLMRWVGNHGLALFAAFIVNIWFAFRR